MKTIRYSARAIKNLKSIAEYTTQNWGAQQKNAYMQELKQCISWLAANPNMGRARRDIAPDLHSFPKCSHIIFYRVKGKYLVIADILHHSEDIPTTF